MKNFGEKIQKLRERRDLSVTDLARLMGYKTHSYVSDIEAGRKFPKTEFIVKIADLFGVTVDQLVRDELEV